MKDGSLLRSLFDGHGVVLRNSARSTGALQVVLFIAARELSSLEDEYLASALLRRNELTRDEVANEEENHESDKNAEITPAMTWHIVEGLSKMCRSAHKVRTSRSSNDIAGP